MTRFFPSENLLYRALARRLPRLSPWLHLLLFACGLGALDLGFRWICRFARVVSFANTMKLMPFTLGWVLVFTAVALLLPRLLRRVYMLAVGLFFCALCVVHGVYINMFRKFFSFADLIFAGDGTAFLDPSYIVIRKLLLAWILLCLVLVLLAVVLTPPDAHVRLLPGGLLALLGVGLLLFTRFAVLGKSTAIIWDQNSDPAFLYEDFSDSRATLTMLGIYQYTFRDVQQLLPSTSTLSDSDRAAIADYTSSRSHEENEMTGALAGKNLILIQLEAIDTWMLEGYMPALKAVKDQSLVFSNHYTPAYITAGTFNTEFIVNTGLLPGSAGIPVSIYTQNQFPTALANLFREEGYRANSFHGSEGEVYNRDAIHKNLGYEEYYGGSEMGMENYQMDSQLMTAFDTMVSDEPFFSFIITFSGHGPYNDDNPIYLAHKEAAHAEAARTESNYIHAAAHAKETDLFVRELMKALEASGHLEDTVVAFYADHYNYYMLDDPLNMEIKGVDSLNLLQHTDFFIYSKDLAPRTVEKYTSSIDVLPTLTNLFGLDVPYELLTGNDIFSEAGGYVFFNDNSWLGGEGDLTGEIALRRKINSLLLAHDYWAFSP